MQKNIEDLDFSNEVDILYAYKNFGKNPEEITRLFQDLKVNESDFGVFCFGIVEQICLFELGEFFKDAEIKEMLEISHIKDQENKKMIKDASKKLANKNVTEDFTLKRDSKTLQQKDKEFIEEIEKMLIDNDLKAPETKEENKYFHIKHLDVLLKPLIDICNKKIVDLVYYIYRKTGINHFDFLFKEFSDEAQRVELHLLVAKGIKARSFDLSDVKEALSSASKQEVTNSTADDINTDDIDLNVLNATPAQSNSNATIEFQVDAKKTTFDSLFESHLNEPIIPLPFLQNSEISLLKPFKIGFSAETHLNEAKKKLMSHGYFPDYFYVEKLASFLCLKFDREIFSKFLSFSDHRLFHVNLNRFPSVPYFFYEYAPIETVLSYIPNSQSNPLNFSPSVCHLAPLKVNCYLLKYFLEFATRSFKSISSPESDYLLIAMSLKTFVENYRSIAFVKIFKDLLGCKIEKVASEIKKILLNDISLYLEVFYNGDKQKIESEIIGWSLDPLKENPSVPTLSDSLENLISSFHNSSFYQDESEKISKYLLSLYYEESEVEKIDRFELMDDFIVEASNNAMNKVFVLKSIELINKLMKTKENRKQNLMISEEPKELKTDEDRAEKVPVENVLSLLKDCAAFDTILNNLKIFPNRIWRYKKLFIEMAGTLEKFGITKEWIKETFSKDKVFYIRKMIEKL